MNVVIDQAYPARIKAISLLRAADTPTDAETLRAAAAQLRTTSSSFGTAEAAHDWADFADAIDIIALLVDWRRASLEAQAEADRFLRAAKLRLSELRERPALSDYGRSIVKTLSPIEGEITPSDVPRIRQSSSNVRMPLAIFAHPEPQIPAWARMRGEAPPPPEEVAVAFLEFTINGQRADTVQTLVAGQVHDLDLAIRVSRWPDGAERLTIAPLSVEPATTWDLPIFEFPRPTGAPPFIFQRRGRMILHAAQGFNARPLEFRYAAEFQPKTDDNERIVIAGQRTLLLDGSEAGGRAITGDRSIDRRILELRDGLRKAPQISGDDVRDALILLGPIGNLMWQSVRANHFPDPIEEAAFQREFQRHLRSYPDVAGELEEQAVVARGRSDLTFRGIRIELKSERAKRLAPEDCRRFAKQAASYAIGTGRQVAILCVLDCSPKTDMPFPVADGLTIFPVETKTTPVYVICCLLQGALAKPSDFSR